MPPKIELLDDTVAKPEPVKKNPFDSKKKKVVVKRDAKDVYPTRRGLNKLQQTGTSPLDVLFHVLETKLDGKLSEISMDILFARFFDGETIDDEFEKRFKLVDRLLDDLLDIQKYSEERVDIEKKDLVKISLHDIKTFSKLVNCIIIHGIYPVLKEFQIGIPIEKRNLKDFATKNEITIDRVSDKSYASQYKLLKLIYTKLLQVFCFDSDVKDLLIKGTGFSDFLMVTIALITIPQFQDKDVLDEYYVNIIMIPDTFELYQTFSLLLASPTASQASFKFKEFVMNQLKMLPTRAPKKDGLLNLIEYVLGLRENEEINAEKFDHISTVVLLKPKEIPTQEYFESIGSQCYELLININRPVILSCVGHIIETLWLKNQLIVKDFFAKRIWSNFNPNSSNSHGIYVTEAQVNNNVNVLLSLSQKALSTDLMTVIVEPILLPMWSYFVFLKNNSKPFVSISNILTSFFTITGDSVESIDLLDHISKNLLWENDVWEFQLGHNKLTEIAKRSSGVNSENKDTKMHKFLARLDQSADYFMEFLADLEDDLIQKLFSRLLKRWLDKAKSDPVSIEETNPLFTLIDLQILEKIGNKFNEILARTPMEILDILDKFLELDNPTSEKKHQVEEEGDSDDEEEEDLFSESFPNVLELLSAILSESTIELNEACVKLLKSIQAKLKLISKSKMPQVSINSSVALYDRIDLLLNDEEKLTVSQHELDAKTLKRAITSLNDPLVPIRAHGLHLLRTLIERKSDAISLDFVINLHLLQLKDSDPFIYLSVIKGIELLIDWNEHEILKLLLDLYLDKNGDGDLDERLRIGEVLLRYIQNSNKLFSGASAKSIVELMLSMIRRSNEKDVVDSRLRMSSMSLLGTCCKTNPIGFVSNLSDVLDCAIGILQLETDKDSAVMRRSAIVLIHDLISGTSESATLEFPNSYKSKVYDTLVYLSDTDNDVLVREQCAIVLSTIKELANLAMDMSLEQHSQR